MNKGLEGYMRSFVGDRPRDWMRWISLVEWAYNTSEHTSTKLSSFKAVFGYPSPRLMPFEPGPTKVQAVEDELKSREFILTLIRENLQDAQAQMKHFADQNCTFREFEVGNWVFLRLRPYRQMSVILR
jgi:hypothetical protein